MSRCSRLASSGRAGPRSDDSENPRRPDALCAPADADADLLDRIDRARLLVRVLAGVAALRPW